jgi:hypothetical protein
MEMKGLKNGLLGHERHYKLFPRTCKALKITWMEVKLKEGLAGHKVFKIY